MFIITPLLLLLLQRSTSETKPSLGAGQMSGAVTRDIFHPPASLSVTIRPGDVGMVKMFLQQHPYLPPRAGVDCLPGPDKGPDAATIESMGDRAEDAGH